MAVLSTVYRMAARSPPASEPRKRKFFLVRAIPVRERSVWIVVYADPAVLGVEGQGVPARQRVSHRFGQFELR